jgi:hypothetical protein
VYLKIIILYQLYITEEDKPLDENHPLLHSLPIRPHISRKPGTSSTEWEKWNYSRENLADKIVRALQNVLMKQPSKEP